MNIWNWVTNLQNDLHEAGQTHNARIIDDLSSYIADHEVTKADALLPEVKALANTLNNPWLSVYTGHWQMRNSLGNKGEGESALSEAVRLFELAHREDTQDCPQSICITQDLAACYRNIDGAGWADDIISVCDETLSRIDPSWGCYVCINAEKALAYIDKKDFATARQIMDNLCNDLAKEGEDDNKAGINSQYNKIDLAQGNYEAVLERIEQDENQHRDYQEWKNISQPRTIQKVNALSRLGRHEEAWDALPVLNSIPIGDVNEWLDAIYPTLMQDANYNTWHMAQHIKPALMNLSEHGSHRLTINMAVQCARLAIARQAQFIAHHYALIAQSHLPKLKTDAGATAQVQQLIQDIENMTITPMPVAADELIAWLTDTENDISNRSPEADLQWLIQALDEQPNDADLVSWTADALYACGLNDDAYQLLWQFVQDHPQHESQMQFILLDKLISQPFTHQTETRTQARIDALCALYKDIDPAFMHWGQARLANQQDDHAKTEAECRQLLTIKPDVRNAKSLLAHSLMQQKRFSEAAEYHLALYEMDTEHNDHAWDYMTAVSSANQWQQLYDMAQRLGLDMDVTDDLNKMPEENWGRIIIRCIQDHQIVDYYAQRLGPVHAKIIENASPKLPQMVDNIITFDGQSLYPEPENEEEAQNFIPTYQVVHTLQVGNYGKSWGLDGVAPTEEQWNAFRYECMARDYRIWWHSLDYQVTDSVTDIKYDGMFATIAVPQSTPISELMAFVKTQTDTWEHPICYYDLAKQAEEDLTAQISIIERYDL